MTVATQQGGGGGSSGLYDVLELILDRGLVIDAYVRVSFSVSRSSRSTYGSSSPASTPTSALPRPATASIWKGAGQTGRTHGAHAVRRPRPDQGSPARRRGDNLGRLPASQSVQRSIAPGLPGEDQGPPAMTGRSPESAVPSPTPARPGTARHSDARLSPHPTRRLQRGHGDDNQAHPCPPSRWRRRSRGGRRPRRGGTTPSVAGAGRPPACTRRLRPAAPRRGRQGRRPPPYGRATRPAMPSRRRHTTASCSRPPPPPPRSPFRRPVNERSASRNSAESLMKIYLCPTNIIA